MNMEKITLPQEDSLLDYLDGKLEGAALSQLKNDLATSPTLQKRLDDLRQVHQFLNTNRLESPTPSFVENVMGGLQKLSATHFPSPRNGMLLVVGVVIAAGMLLSMVSAGFFDQFNGLISLEQIAPAKKYFQQSLPSLPVNGKLLVKILVGLNLVIAFIVLDRTVFRPFFQRRAGG